MLSPKKVFVLTSFFCLGQNSTKSITFIAYLSWLNDTKMNQKSTELLSYLQHINSRNDAMLFPLSLSTNVNKPHVQGRENIRDKEWNHRVGKHGLTDIWPSIAHLTVPSWLHLEIKSDSTRHFLIKMCCCKMCLMIFTENDDDHDDSE